jgi:hypothetical protein
MKKILWIAVVLALASGAASAAQMYRWVDEKGAVEYRDTPPPSTAKKVEQRTMSGNTIETSTLPYSVQQAIKNYPVTLWTFDCGPPCNLAAAHLAKRGIPHTVRYSNKEPEVLKKLTGGTEVPILLVGPTQLRGYLETTWDAALDNAGYPRTPAPGTKPQGKVAESSKDAEPAKGKEPAAKPAGDAASKGSPAPAAK